MSGIRIVIAGAAGRMGRTLVRAVLEDGAFSLAGALEAPAHPDLGTDAGWMVHLPPANIPVADDARAATLIRSSSAVENPVVPIT